MKEVLQYAVDWSIGEGADSVRAWVNESPATFAARGCAAAFRRVGRDDYVSDDVHIVNELFGADIWDVAVFAGSRPLVEIYDTWDTMLVNSEAHGVDRLVAAVDDVRGHSFPEGFG